MPRYVPKRLIQYNHQAPKNPQDCPLAPAPRQFGKDSQRLNKPDTSALLPANNKLRIQKIVDSFLYYCRAVNNTTLNPLNVIGSEQSKPTKLTKKKSNQLLDYMATHP